MTAFIMSALTGKSVRPKTLLPEVFPGPLVYTKEEKQRELDEIKKEVGLN